MNQKIRWALTLLTASFVLSSTSRANGPIKTIWGCNIPCQSKDTHETLKSIQVSYCSFSTLSEKMIADLTPSCQQQNGRTDAVAIRTSKTNYASCLSSGNTCTTDGLSPAGFTCSFLCPSEDQVVHKFSACATTSFEAWSFVTQICKGATPPDKSIYAPAELCTPDGQTPCQ
jgi:hypothetical protein